jgi:hypothetical protein
MDRVLHRQLHELKQSASEAELHQRLADLARDLGLATLSFRRPGPEGWREVAWSLPPEEVPGGELITVTLSDGPAGAERYWELAASVASASFDQSWPRLINWLRGLAHAAAQAMDNQKP